MVSRKRSARAKQVAAFKDQLGSMDSAFDRARQRAEEHSRDRENALRRKTCESKNRYSSASEAQAVIRECAEHGTTGLHSYRCPYCNGWHLTSKPLR